ncbi:Homeobox-leucine zipper protein GLABRA 2 [Hibiscus syriacus]|uniref:Homeobox-leucine zipper protein GLABRA 2 n=1 Tax=Hibiscus syriacus TaxID=106335 RepID=A0A6A2YN36_HIBSY|nr:Homeobox-leucine zipper protein GLABRA 2 [Hibiscus syriacus]
MDDGGMFAELQMLTPLVPTREVYFVRSRKQLSAEQWAIVDVSIDKVEDNIDASLVKCTKRPSGCIIQDNSNCHCKVTWIEHFECRKRAVVRSILVFGIPTSAGRKSILKLGQRMRRSFCHAIGASSYNTWNKVTTKTGEDITVSSRKNLHNPGEPLGVIVCAVSSIWLPVSLNLLFDFLRDEARRHEWDIMSNGGSVKCIANLAKGQDQGNAVTVQASSPLPIREFSRTKIWIFSLWIISIIQIESCLSVSDNEVQREQHDVTQATLPYYLQVSPFFPTGSSRVGKRKEHQFRRRLFAHNSLPDLNKQLLICQTNHGIS